MPLFTRKIPRHGLMLVLAVLMGVIAAWLGGQAVEDRLAELEEQGAQTGQDLVEVVVAQRDLSPGEVLNSQVLAVRSMPKQYVHASAISPDRFDRIDNARLQVAVQRGEALLEAHIDALGQGVFSSVLQKGMRALTFEVDDVSSTAGMLRPGDHVDLIYVLRPESVGAGEERQIFPLLSNLRVLATGQSLTKHDARGAERRYTNVTLEVAPADANRILLARSTGEVTALLRHPEDESRNEAPPLTAAALRPGPLAPVPPAPPPRRWQRPVEYVVGGAGAGAPGPVVGEGVLPSVPAPLAAP